MTEHPPAIEPVETKWARLGDLADINPKWNPLAAKEDPVSFVGMAQMSDELGAITGEEQRLVQEVRTGYTAFEKDDLLVAKITPCFENGKIGRANITNRWGAGSTEFHVVRPGDRLDRGYALHFLRRQQFKTSGKLRMTGSGGQQRVPASYVADTKIPLLPLPEQRRVAAILDKAGHVRAQRREAIANLDALTQSIFLTMFPIESRNPTQELSEVVAPGTVVTYGIVQAGEEFPGGVPYIRTGDLTTGEISSENLRHTDPLIAAKFSRSRVAAGDIVMSIRATVGTVAITPTKLDGANLTQGTARIAPGPNVTSHYLLEYLRSRETQRWIWRQVKGATFKEITLARLRELPIDVPPLQLQQTFARRVAGVERLKEQHRIQLAELDTLFASLQHRAFKGEL